MSSARRCGKRRRYSTGAPAVTGAPSGVYARAWRHEGKVWLLAVSAADSAKNCVFEVSGVGSVNMSLTPLGVEMRSL